MRTIRDRRRPSTTSRNASTRLSFSSRAGTRPAGAYRLVPGVAEPAAACLYEQPGIRITPEWFIVAGRRYPVSELSDLHTVRGAPDRLTVRAVVASVVVLIAIGVALGFRGFDRLSPAACLALAAAALVPVALAWVGHRVRPRPYELWGRYRGLRTLLFSSDEERQYGQVTRALLRAREVSRLGGLADPVVAELWEPDRR